MLLYLLGCTVGAVVGIIGCRLYWPRYVVAVVEREVPVPVDAPPVKPGKDVSVPKKRPEQATSGKGEKVGHDKPAHTFTVKVHGKDDKDAAKLLKRALKAERKADKAQRKP